VARNDTISIWARIGLTAEVANGILNSSMMGRNAIIKAKKGDNNEPQK
jgi:hypothetical protein